MEPTLPLLQHPLTCDTLRTLGARVRWLDIGPAAPPVMMVERRFFGLRIGMVSRGPIWRAITPEVRIAGLSSLARSGVRILNLYEADDGSARNAGYRQIMTPASLALLGLHTSEDEQIRQMKQKWRNRLYRALDAPLLYSNAPFDPNVHTWLLHRNKEEQRRKKFRSYPDRFTLAYTDVSPEASRMFIAQDTSGPVAAMLFLKHGKMASYHIGWSNQTGRSWNAHNALLFYAMRYFAELGVRTLDLGTIDTDQSPGLARFKLGSGAEVHRTGGTWIFPPFAKFCPRATPSA